jgi:hypothetical protein
LSNSKRTTKDHRHYVIGKVVEILRVRSESLLANRTTRDNNAFAALSESKADHPQKYPSSGA